MAVAVEHEGRGEVVRLRVDVLVLADGVDGGGPGGEVDRQRVERAHQHGVVVAEPERAVREDVVEGAR